MEHCLHSRYLINPPQPQLSYILLIDNIFDSIQLNTSPSNSTEENYRHPVESKLSYTDFHALIVKLVLQHLQHTNQTQLQMDTHASYLLTSNQQPIIILLGGTSGTGKSTLASLLSTRLAIPTILSTDHVRHLLRTFHAKTDYPFLYSSSYNTLEVISHHSCESQKGEDERTDKVPFNRM
jgi:2-phosphoglycerate kinase